MWMSCSGATPLHYACSRGFDAVVKRLLHAGAEINIKDNQNLVNNSFQGEG